jgi:hypothetical protein
MGGVFFALTGQVKPQKSTTEEDMERGDIEIGHKIDGYLERNIFFDLTFPSRWTKAQLKCAVEELGADHILFGGSYPVRREWLLKGVQHIESLDISDREKQLILGENAMKLFKIKA